MVTGAFHYIGQRWPGDSASHLANPDERRAYQAYWSDRSCGLACVAMVLRRRLGQAPSLEQLHAAAIAGGAYCDRGWIHAGLARLIDDRGVRAEAVAAEPDRVLTALVNGAMFIASVRLHLPDSDEAHGGHLILLRGACVLSGTTYVLFADPSSWGSYRTSIRAVRLFRSYSGRGVMILPKDQ
jgi:hypothetical protein